MNKINFDDYADEYNAILSDQTRFFADDNRYFAEYKVKIVRRYVRREPERILEYGCGIGRNLRYFNELFHDAQIFGCDVSKRSLEIAKSENRFANFFLPGEEGFSRSFDLIFVAGVFHHVIPSERSDVIRKIIDMLSVQGEIFIFEHNPWNPITRYLVKACPFDLDATLIPRTEMSSLVKGAGLTIIKSGFTLFIPSFLKRFRMIEPYMEWLPLGGQYFIHAAKK